MIKVKCIKELSDFVVGEIYEAFVDNDEDADYHYNKGEKVKGKLIELYCNILDCNDINCEVTIGQLPENTYNSEDINCWYLDEFFKEYFEITTF